MPSSEEIKAAILEWRNARREATRGILDVRVNEQYRTALDRLADAENELVNIASWLDTE
jgi:hypothetical protein